MVATRSGRLLAQRKAGIFEECKATAGKGSKLNEATTARYDDVSINGSLPVERDTKERDESESEEAEDERAADGECQSLPSWKRGSLAAPPDLMELITRIFDSLPFSMNTKSIQAHAVASKHIHTLDIIPLSDEDNSSLDPTKGLDSSLQCDIDPSDLYFKVDMSNFAPVTRLRDFEMIDEVLEKSVLVDGLEKMAFAPVMMESKRQVKYRQKKLQDETAGKGWFNLPKTEITPEIKRDFQIMQMRDILDPHRHYKKDRKRKYPKYFQMGTIVSNSADFYSSRTVKKDRKGTIVDELLADAAFRQRNKRKYLELQSRKQSGRKGFYKQRLERRKPTWSRKKH